MELIKISLDKLKLVDELQAIHDLVPFAMDEEHAVLKRRIVDLMAFINQIQPDSNNAFYPRINARRQ